MAVVDILRKWIPKQLRYFIQRYLSTTSMKIKHRIATNELSHVRYSDENLIGLPLRIGILTNAAQYHKNYVKACLEMGVPFTVIDLYSSDWLEQVIDSKCDAFVNWPDAFLPIWNKMFKDRVRIIEHELGYMMLPGWHEIWAYEDKSRMAYWLEAHGIPCPKTRVFFNMDEALHHAEECDLPVVVKTNFGAAGAGVKIFRHRNSLTKLVKRTFKRGWIAAGIDHHEKQWGTILFQEYIPDAVEWRLVRIGDSFFGHAKGKCGDYHSGSGKVVWSVPDKTHLDFLYNITEKGGFRSMDLDVFESNGKFYVNEIQAVFGASVSIDQLRIDGKAGRYIRSMKGEWVFEEGDFARNACANERIRYLIQLHQAKTVQE